MNTKKFTKAECIVGLYTILIILISCFLSPTIKAQSLKKITGIDPDGTSNKTLPDVSVKVKGTDRGGGITAAEGKYSLQAGNTDVLVFSFIGFETQEVTVGSQTVRNIVLKARSTFRQEVVDIGYGTRNG